MFDVENILSEVRSRLLDFAVELRDVVGIDVPEKELAAKASAVDTEKDVQHRGLRELESLRNAVLEDKTQGKTPDVAEGATGKWYTTAIKEAGKGAVKASIDVVSSVIVKAMKAYTTGDS